MAYADVGDLRVDESLYSFVVDELLPGSGVSEDSLWAGLASLIDEFVLRNAVLLEKRAWLQTQIHAWHLSRYYDVAEYRRFLEDIGYLVPSEGPFEILTNGVDPEISTIAGPQLVVSVMNERYALIPVPGGVLIIDSEQAIIGAVGATGDTSDNEEAAAVAGSEAAAFQARTG